MSRRRAEVISPRHRDLRGISLASQYSMTRSGCQGRRCCADAPSPSVDGPRPAKDFLGGQYHELSVLSVLTSNRKFRSWRLLESMKTPPATSPRIMQRISSNGQPVRGTHCLYPCADAPVQETNPFLELSVEVANNGFWSMTFSSCDRGRPAQRDGNTRSLQNFYLALQSSDACSVHWEMR